MMRARARIWLSTTSCVLSLTLTALSLLLLSLNLTQPGGQAFGHWLENTMLAICFSIIGAVIVPFGPARNPIGWLFCATGLIWAVVHFCAEYALYTMVTAPASLPGGEIAAGLFACLWPPQFGIVAVSGLLFPDGRLPGRRWRWLVPLYLLVMSTSTVLSAAAFGPISADFPVRNPLGIPGVPNAYKALEAVMFSVNLVAAVSMLMRLRRAQGMERQQIKWYAYAVTVAIVGGILTHTIARPMRIEWLVWVGPTLLAIGLLAIPIAMGVAIMRYRLYDIDIIIRHTLLYSALTASLAALYFASVTVFQWALGPIFGADSEAGTVVSTLAIATLFQPLHRRIKGFIDRRFYRRQYDAARTLSEFSARLRNEVDLNKVGDELVAVVQETMQPTHVSLWTRSTEGKR